MIPFVIDANAINAFQQERISGGHGTAHAAVAAIFESNCIALDRDKLCLQEWIDCAGGKEPYALMDWVTDELISGRIRFFELSDTSSRKHLESLGLPKIDHKWVRLAIGSEGKKLVSGDIDFFEPSLKKASSKIKNRIRSTRSGMCCKSLRKVYGIEVMCLEHVPDEVAA